MVLNAVNKLKFALPALLALGMILSVSSCTEEDSANLPDNVSIYQKYMVCFSQTQPTLAYACFTKEKDVAFKEIKLTGNQGIKANRKDMEYHFMDNNARLDYSYFLKLNNDTRVSFVFYRNATKILVNYAYKKDIKPILIPAELKEISNGQSVKWVGDSLTDDEMLEVSLSNSSKKRGPHGILRRRRCRQERFCIQQCTGRYVRTDPEPPAQAEYPTERRHGQRRNHGGLLRQEDGNGKITPSSSPKNVVFQPPYL